MKNQMIKKVCLATLMFLMVLCTSCAFGSSQSQTSDKTPSSTKDQDSENTQFQGESGNFAEEHDAFVTKLSKEYHDNDPIPDPPKGEFDLVKYSSKVGDLAAYVSCDPGDGQKHPLIIWVTGGWGNGIDDYSFSYPEWENDQTGSAFWRAGILTMYPSFRGGSGNPGYYETLFGEVDDIISAYDYAASLPYVDSSRIYLGGHSTGGTRVLLAAEHTDKFRAVFGFGAVDEIKNHNNAEFKFDKNMEDECKMRSPIYWLDNIKTPTFLIEGEKGNSHCLQNIKEASKNENIYCYILNGEDHFTVLAPLTRLIAKKIIADTGEEINISITQEELENAMEEEPDIPEPSMKTQKIKEAGVQFSIPYIWELSDCSEEEGELLYYAESTFSGENAWDLSVMYVDCYTVDDGVGLDVFADSKREQGYDVEEVKINGISALKGYGYVDDDYVYKNSFVAVQKDDNIIIFDFFCNSDFEKESDIVFEKIAESIKFK